MICFHLNSFYTITVCGELCKTLTDNILNAKLSATANKGQLCHSSYALQDMIQIKR